MKEQNIVEKENKNKKEVLKDEKPAAKKKSPAKKSTAAKKKPVEEKKSPTKKKSPAKEKSLIEKKEIEQKELAEEEKLVKQESFEENKELDSKEELKEERPVVDKTYQAIIEEARARIYKDYAKSRRISNIMMFVAVIVIAAIMFMITSNNNVLLIIGYVLLGLLIVGLIVYYVLNRNKFPNKTKDYVKTVVDKMNERMFCDPLFSDMVYDSEKRLEMSDLIGDGVYMEAASINSRNVVSGVYNGQPFSYAEAALVRTVNRRKPLPPLFVGRYITMPNNLKFDGRFVVVLKNVKEPLDLPNSVNDLVLLEEKEDLAIYGPEGSDFHKIVKNDLINKLRKIKIQNHLLNVNLAIWGGRYAAYLSYDDSIMAVPFQKPFDYNGFEESCGHLAAILEVFAGE
ncbi:MAG TPA: hypothetical protein GX010_02245 [Erysipelotrichaceae bacterium]|nr:hypothetical protein [Erysipelotrichaceae bacterium]